MAATASPRHDSPAPSRTPYALRWRRKYRPPGQPWILAGDLNLLYPGLRINRSLLEAKLEEMRAFVQTSGCKEVLHELYEKLVVEQPDDPIDFLIGVLQPRAAAEQKS